MQPTVRVENFRCAAALGYAAIGWLVVPLHWPRIGTGRSRCSCGRDDCGSVGKHPLTPNGLKDSSADPATVSAWWDEWPQANVGIATGAGSGVVVVDVDPRDGGNESLSDLGDTHGQLPETVEASTGGGGIHLFFRHPGGTVRNSAGKLGLGLDVRGDGGYVVAAPSQHASGRRYAWQPGADPSDVLPAEMPEWLRLALVEKPKPADPAPAGPRFADDAGRHWLGKALARADVGTRNDTGYWLACQLRDNRIPLPEAERLMVEYARRCPGGDSAYVDREAVASVRSAYAGQPREPARSGLLRVGGVRPASVIASPPANAATELREHLHAVADGRIFDARLPWPLLSRWSCSMLPGTVTAVVGDPGVGKTFLTLDCLRYWHGNGIACAVYFVEKDRRFHTQRLLAQLEGDGRFVDYEWLPGKTAEVDDAIRRHGEYIADLGRCIHSASGDDVNFDELLSWIRQMASAGKRVLVIDPVTAADAGRERWETDRQFMVKAQKICAAHGTSLVLVTHPRRGNRTGGATLHDVAGGAAFVRLADTVLWVNKPKKPRKVKVKCTSDVGVRTTVERIALFIQCQKTRNGRGNGMELAYSFGDGLRFCEHGLVTGDVRDGEEEAA